MLIGGLRSQIKTADREPDEWTRRLRTVMATTLTTMAAVALMAMRVDMLRMILLRPIFSGISPGTLSKEEFGLRTIGLGRSTR